MKSVQYLMCFVSGALAIGGSGSALAAPAPARPTAPRIFYRYKAPPIISLYVSDEEKRDNSLRLAAREGREQILEPLLRSGANIDGRSSDNETPLIYASRACHPDVVKRLLRLGAKVDLVDRKGRSALIHAARSSCVPVVKTLLNARARRTLRDGSGRSALHYARGRAVVEVGGPDSEIVHLLMKDQLASIE